MNLNKNSYDKTVIVTIGLVLCAILALLYRQLNAERTKDVDELCDSLADLRTSRIVEPLDIIRFHQWNNFGACRNVKFFGGTWTSELTKLDGHKAVCLDAGIRPEPRNCIVYSFGVREDWSFDQHMADYGCEVHSFDPSVDAPHQLEGSAKFTFHKIGLNGIKNEVNKQGWKMMTLPAIMKMLNHTDKIIDVIKLDIEGYEYEALRTIIDSGVAKQIKQVAAETHNFSLQEKDRKDYYRKFEALLYFEQNGFRRYSSQPAMYADIVNKMAGMSDYFCYELAWYNRRFYQ